MRLVTQKRLWVSKEAQAYLELLTTVIMCSVEVGSQQDVFEASLAIFKQLMSAS